MIDEEFKNKIYSEIPDLNKIKSNPNSYPIIKKYNYKIYQKNKFDIFNIIEKEIEDRYENKTN